MKVTYDTTVDAIYFELRALAPGTAHTQQLTEDISVDYGPDGKIAGIEILDASQIIQQGELQRVVFELYPAKAA